MAYWQKVEIGRHILSKLPDSGIVAFGSGTTVNAIISELGNVYAKKKHGKLMFVSGSTLTSEHLAKAGLPEIQFHRGIEIAVCIDGADQISTGDVNYILKGRGGALLREKVLWRYSKKVIVGVTENKLVSAINGTIPVEFTPYSIPYVESAIKHSYPDFSFKLRSHESGLPFYTDGGNWIFDLSSPDAISDPHTMACQLKTITGVLDTGLFTDFQNVEAIIHSGKNVYSLSLTM